MSLIEVRRKKKTTRVPAVTANAATSAPQGATALVRAAARFIEVNAAYRHAYETWREQRESCRPGECSTSAADERRDQRHRTLFAAHQRLAAAAAAVGRAGGQIDYSPADGDTVRIYGPGHQLIGRM